MVICTTVGQWVFLFLSIFQKYFEIFELSYCSDCTVQILYHTVQILYHAQCKSFTFTVLKISKSFAHILKKVSTFFRRILMIIFLKVALSCPYSSEHKSFLELFWNGDDIQKVSTRYQFSTLIVKYARYP